MSARSATTGPGLPPLQHGDDAGVSHARFHVVAQAAQLVGDDLRGARLAVAELRMLMEIAPPGDDLRQSVPASVCRPGLPTDWPIAPSQATGTGTQDGRHPPNVSCAWRDSMTTFLSDLRLGFRLFLRRPGIAARRRAVAWPSASAPTPPSSACCTSVVLNPLDYGEPIGWSSSGKPTPTTPNAGSRPRTSSIGGASRDRSRRSPRSTSSGRR